MMTRTTQDVTLVHGDDKSHTRDVTLVHGDDKSHTRDVTLVHEDDKRHTRTGTRASGLLAEIIFLVIIVIVIVTAPPPHQEHFQKPPVDPPSCLARGCSGGSSTCRSRRWWSRCPRCAEPGQMWDWESVRYLSESDRQKERTICTPSQKKCWPPSKKNLDCKKMRS